MEPLEPQVELRSFSGALEGWSPWHIDYETVVPGDAAFVSLYVGSADEEHLICTVGLFARNVNQQIMDIFEETVEKTRRALVDSMGAVGEKPELEPSDFPAVLPMMYVSDLPVVPTEAAMLIAEKVACEFWLTVDDETTEVQYRSSPSQRRTARDPARADQQSTLYAGAICGPCGAPQAVTARQRVGVFELPVLRRLGRFVGLRTLPKVIGRKQARVRLPLVHRSGNARRSLR